MSLSQVKSAVRKSIKELREQYQEAKYNLSAYNNKGISIKRKIVAMGMGNFHRLRNIKIIHIL